jgi:hypothetical protein
MPFYTFETKDKGIEEQDRVFLVRLSFAGYDEAMSGKETKEGWHRGKTGPVHPKTEKPVKTWRRLQERDNVSVQFAQPWESSKWDSFEYRAGYNMMKARRDRAAAESTSNVGSTPIQDYERQALGDPSFDLGERDISQHENSIE